MRLGEHRLHNHKKKNICMVEHKKKKKNLFNSIQVKG